MYDNAVNTTSNNVYADDDEEADGNAINLKHSYKGFPDLIDYMVYRGNEQQPLMHTLAKDVADRNQIDTLPNCLNGNIYSQNTFFRIKARPVLIKNDKTMMTTPWSNEICSAPFFEKNVKSVSFTAKNKKIRLKWKATSGATGYRIYIATGKHP